MAYHPAPCDICARIEAIQLGDTAPLIHELPTGFFVLGDSQQFPGYALLLCKTPIADLEELPWDARLAFLRDLALCSQAVFDVVRPHKMNVESLGNVVPHLHFHLFPRQLSEAAPTKPVWLGQNDATPFDPARDGALVARLRTRIEELARERA